MITITLDGRSFRVEGHADYDVRGKDIVCSAISAMAQQTIFGLEYSTRIKIDESDGYLDVIVAGNNVQSMVLMYAFEDACRAIQKQYPDHVQVLGGIA